MPFVNANGVRTFYRSVGEGPPLLLIAGNGMEHTTFDEQLPVFSPRFRCIVYDMRGIGASDTPEDVYTTREMAVDAFSLLDALDIPRAHVGGYSLGGVIGQEMALSAPERVASLSLYSTFDKADPYLRLRYDLLVKVLRESSPEMWAMFTAFSAFGENYINAHEAEIRDEIGRRLLSPGNEDALLDFVFSHVVSGRVSGSTAATTLNDQTLTIMRDTNGMVIGGANVVQTIDLPQDKQLVVVDRILSSSKLRVVLKGTTAA